MAPRRARMYSTGEDTRCAEVRKFIEDSGVLLEVRDVIRDPLSKNELSRLIGHLNIEHFLNKLSESYLKHKLDENLPPREEVLQMMADDPTLLRRPIVESSRLITVGCDKRKIAEMLQISSNGNQASNNQPDNRGNRKASAAGANR